MLDVTKFILLSNETLCVIKGQELFCSDLGRILLMTYLFDLVLARFIDQQLLVVLYAHQLGNEICQSHG